MINMEEVQRLAECAENDKEFTEKFVQAMNARNIDEVIRLAAEKDFTFTKEDFDFPSKRKLDLDELDYAVGGLEACTTSMNEAVNVFLSIFCLPAAGVAIGAIIVAYSS